MDLSASLPTLEWSVSCKVMGDVVENDDLLSLLKPYIHDRTDLHSLCLTNKMFNSVFSQSLFDHLVVKHTHVHCAEPDSEEFAALLKSSSLRHTRELSFLHMDQLSYMEDDSSRYGPILNGAICQIVKRLIGIDESAVSWQKFVAELLSFAPRLKELSLSIKPAPGIHRRGEVQTFRMWRYVLPSLCDEYKALEKPPLKLRKLNLDENVGFVCDPQGSIEYINSLTDLAVLEELRVFDNQMYSANLIGVLPPLMPYKLFTYDKMPRLRRFSFGDMDDDIMEWLIYAAETPFKNQLTLRNDGVDHWEGGVELFEAISSQRARKRDENPLINFTTRDVEPILRPILWTDFDSPLFPYTPKARLVVPGRFRLGDAKHRRFKASDRLGDCIWIKSMRVFVESVSPSMNELLSHLNGMHAIEQLMIVSYKADSWEGFARLDDNPTWKTNVQRIAVALPSLTYLKVNRMSWRLKHANDGNELVAERLTAIEDEMLGRFPPLSDLPQ
ncbi:hypothetical protein COL154_002927 [Colletotrichum chrysophilum]|nr:hypothetical protein COL154_002927 [Colletotrichum chrysophilum]